MDEGSESRSIERAQRGDRAAFEALLDLHQEPVRAFLHRLGVGRSDVDDAAQEVFMVLVRDLSRFRGESSFRTFVFGIAVNVARAARRRRAPVALDVAEETDSGLDPAAPSEAAELAVRLRALIRRLPEPLREAFLLRHVEELSVAAAAAALALPEGTVKRHAFEARERLKLWLAGSEAVR